MLDGEGRSKINTGCGFLDHMLTLFAYHSRFDLELSCAGDKWVDYHHTVEDVGMALGEAFCRALGDKKGITRYADRTIPMDETLVLCAVDASGRAHLEYKLAIPTQRVGDFDTELCEEFFTGFVREAKITMHLRQLSGKNSHHIIECAFKAFARALSDAVRLDGRFSGEAPSTKGKL